MKKMAMALCALMLVAAALLAGCTQDASPDDSGAAATVQYTQAPDGLTPAPPAPAEITEAPAPDLAGSPAADAAAADEDSPPDLNTSGSQATTMAPDSADLGNPIP